MFELSSSKCEACEEATLLEAPKHPLKELRRFKVASAFGHFTGPKPHLEATSEATLEATPEANFNCL
jgi:hypothetical protein